MPSRNSPAPKSRNEIIAQLASQLRYAQFTIEDYNRDMALMTRVDEAPRVTFSQFRILAKRHGWTVNSLAAFVKGELDDPKRTIKRILKTGPTDTVILYTCLIELYLKATAKPAEGKPPGKGFCADGCGQRVIGRQRFASDACRKRAARRVA
jgi:hypothetical protein